MKVIKSNCHLFVEKPLFSMNEANNLIKEAEKRKYRSVNDIAH
jgi:predicted dehydrogenase